MEYAREPLSTIYICVFKKKKERNEGKQALKVERGERKKNKGRALKEEGKGRDVVKNRKKERQRTWRRGKRKGGKTEPHIVPTTTTVTPLSLSTVSSGKALVFPLYIYI